MLTTDERRHARTTIEVAVLTCLRSVGDDAGAIAEILEHSDLDVSVLVAMRDAVAVASDAMRSVRDSAEANVRADAIEAAERITNG